MNILFRADSSSTIGTGHIMRDLVLAKQYQEENIIFATQKLEGNLNSKILEEGYTVESLSSNNLEELIEVIKQLQIDMIIIDHYGINYESEKLLKEKTNVKVMVLDDTYEKHYCDILLNHNIYANEDRYKNLVPKNCELRCGEKFTLLREEFYIAKANKKPLPTSTIQLFLAMGGADSANLNISTLEVLNRFPTIHTHVVTTKANQHIDALKEYAQNRTNITLHINSNKIAQLMAESHLAIVTPSVTLNEVNFMELFFIPIQTAENQSEMVAFLEEHDYPVLKEFDDEVLYHTIKSFLVFHQ